MKKLLSVFAAAAMLFGFASCSGDLHDAEIAPLYIEGTAWGARTPLELVDETTQKISFTYTGQTGWDALANEIHFKIIATPTGWSDDFGGSDTETITLSMNGDYVATHSRVNEALPDTKHIILEKLDMDTEYTIWVNFTASTNTVKIKVEGPDPIPTKDVFVVANNKLYKMKMDVKNTSYSFEIEGDGKDCNYSVFDGEESYGLTATKDVTGSAAVEMVKGGEFAKFATLDQVKYLVYVNINEDGEISTNVQPSLYNFKYGITYINSNYGNYPLNWTMDGAVAVATVTIPAGTANGWSQPNDSPVEFGICKGDNDWSVKFTGATVGPYIYYATTEGANDNNKATLNPSKEDVVIKLKSTDSAILVTCEAASLDKDALCFAKPIGSFNSNYGNYPLVWSATATAGTYEAKVTIPAGTENGWGQANDADVEFGVCNDTSWSIKFTGGTLAAAGVDVALTEGADANNKAAVNPSAADVVITLTATKDSVKAKF